MYILIYVYTYIHPTGKIRGAVDTECFIYLVSKDRHKFGRVCKLLETYEDLKTVQKQTIEDVDAA